MDIIRKDLYTPLDVLPTGVPHSGVLLGRAKVPVIMIPQFVIQACELIPETVWVFDGQYGQFTSSSEKIDGPCRCRARA